MAQKLSKADAAILDFIFDPSLFLYEFDNDNDAPVDAQLNLAGDANETAATASEGEQTFIHEMISLF